MQVSLLLWNIFTFIPKPNNLYLYFNKMNNKYEQYNIIVFIYSFRCNISKYLKTMIILYNIIASDISFGSVGINSVAREGNATVIHFCRIFWCNIFHYRSMVSKAYGLLAYGKCYERTGEIQDPEHMHSTVRISIPS